MKDSVQIKMHKKDKYNGMDNLWLTIANILSTKDAFYIHVTTEINKKKHVTEVYKRHIWKWKVKDYRNAGTINRGGVGTFVHRLTNVALLKINQK